MDFRPVNTAVIGAGAISDIYLSNMIHRFSILNVTKICAAHLSSAQKKADRYNLTACTYEEILADPSIELIVNLTPAHAHYDLIRRALLAGKHVYTEKTVTDSPEKAKELQALAKEKGLFLASAPDTFFGSAFQTARAAIDAGMIGTVTSFCASANRCNDVLLSMFSFLRESGGGVCYDYAVYYMTILISLLGPAQTVSAMIRAPYPVHTNINPESPLFHQDMDTPNESEVYAVIRLNSGVTGTFHLNADSVLNDQAFFAIYGTKGILYLPDPNQFGQQVHLLKNNPDFETEPEHLILENHYAFSENSRGVGPADLAYALRQGRMPRADISMACHVLDLLTAFFDSSALERFVTVSSSCDRPAPLVPDTASEEESLWR